MSHYSGLRCMKCECCHSHVNHSEELWPKVIEFWPVIRPLFQAKKDAGEQWPWELEVNVYVSGDHDSNNDNLSLFEWLLEHADHGIQMISEYFHCLPKEHPLVVLLPPKGNNE